MPSEKVESWRSISPWKSFGDSMKSFLSILAHLPTCPVDSAPFFHLLGQGSDSFKLNQPEKAACFSHGHWASEFHETGRKLLKWHRVVSCRSPLRMFTRLSQRNCYFSGTPTYKPLISFQMPGCPGEALVRRLQNCVPEHSPNCPRLPMGTEGMLA